jgi:hypothetical protein
MRYAIERILACHGEPEETDMKPKNARRNGRNKPSARRVAGVLLWACGIIAGLFGGNYGLPVALALFVIGFFLFVSTPAAKSKH